MRNTHGHFVEDPKRRAEAEAAEFNERFEMGSAVVMGADSNAPGRPGFVMGPARVVTVLVAVVDIAGMDRPIPVKHVFPARSGDAGTLEEDLAEVFDE